MPETGELTGLSVLLVEDDLILATSLADIVEGFGATVVGPCAGNAQALETLESREDIGAAVIDVSLAFEKSYPVADALNARAIPFVFATGFSSVGWSGDGPPPPVIRKPYEEDDLLAALSAAIRARA